MLVLSRTMPDSAGICICHPDRPDEIMTITLVGIDRNKVRLAMDVPRDYAIWRGEMSDDAVAEIMNNASERNARRKSENGSQSTN